MSFKSVFLNSRGVSFIFLLFFVEEIFFKKYISCENPINYILGDEHHDDWLDEDYTNDAIRKLSSSGNTGHRSFLEEFQRSHLTANNHGEGRLTRTGLCGSEEEIHKSIKAVDCTLPVIKTIRLKSPGPNFEIVPSIAQVKRCSGHCHHPRSCLPKTRKTVTIPVYQIDKSSSRPSRSCATFQLDQHEECHCGCAIKRHHCTQKQIYDEGQCACICQNYEAKADCLEKEILESRPQPGSESSEILARYWDDATCQCTCIPKGCRVGVWVPSLCKCVNIQEVDDTGNMLF